MRSWMWDDKWDDKIGYYQYLSHEAYKDNGLFYTNYLAFCTSMYTLENDLVHRVTLFVMINSGFAYMYEEYRTGKVANSCLRAFPSWEDTTVQRGVPFLDTYIRP